MLNHLSVRNFTLVEALDLEFQPGMTAITGETGAGKSILLDALSLTLGDRADYAQIRNGADRAEVTASFVVGDHPQAREWLESQAMDSDDLCILRRVITAAGKSTAWINGQMVTLQQLRELAEILISVHSQHEHQALGRKPYHREILDHFAGLEPEVERVGLAFDRWKATEAELRELQSSLESATERRQLLQFQQEELETLDLKAGEPDALESEQRELANAESILSSLAGLLELLNEGEEFNLADGLGKATDLISRLPAQTEAISQAEELIRSAAIQSAEAVDLLRREADRVELNPERLAEVEARLGLIFDLTRKYRCSPDELIALRQDLERELESLSDPRTALEAAQKRSEELQAEYLAGAQKLSHARARAAVELCQAVNAHFDALSMSGAEIQFALVADEDRPTRLGIDAIELRVRTNPGQPHGPIARIASGGELSRISLAIQVVTARSGQTPTLVFDEVDVGIGGATADTVGRLLRELGDRAQVVCVTHLAQVASKAHQQLRVSKSSHSGATHSQIDPLDPDERIEELARMLGGARISDQSRANARELLESVGKP